MEGQADKVHTPNRMLLLAQETSRRSITVRDQVIESLGRQVHDRSKQITSAACQQQYNATVRMLWNDLLLSNSAVLRSFSLVSSAGSSTPLDWAPANHPCLNAMHTRHVPITR